MLTLGLSDANMNFVLCNINIQVNDPTDACTATPMMTTDTGVSTFEADHQLTENPEVVKLSQARAYPNPFAVKAQIEYTLATPALTRIEIYDAQGKVVDQLLNQVMSSGNHRIFWTPQNQASGLYFVRIQVEEEPAQVLRVRYGK